MRILFLSFYHPPDLSAGSFRASALIKALLPRLPAGSHIEVLTTMPNRYSSYSAEAPVLERSESLSVRRILLPQHRSGMRDQSQAFLRYAREVRTHVRDRKYDLVFATSSRLMTAALGAWVARKQQAPLYLDIRDIFVDTMEDILPRWIAWSMGGFFSMVERFAIGRASKVNLVSRGFEEYFFRRYPQQLFSFFPNGIDDEFLGLDFAADGKESRPPYSILYAGNLGEGQGLHAVVPPLAKALEGKAEFKIIGDGGRKAKLIDAVRNTGADNVHFFDPVNRDQLIKAYGQADVLFLHLNDYNAFKKVLPSKIFEYAATGKPILAGIGGYAADFVRAEIRNAEVFEPCDVEQAIQAFARLRKVPVVRTEFIAKFQRRSIMERLADDVLSVARKGGGAHSTRPYPNR